MGGLSVKKKEEMSLRKSAVFTVVFTKAQTGGVCGYISKKNLQDYPCFTGLS